MTALGSPLTAGKLAPCNEPDRFRERRLSLDEWHLREAVAIGAVGDDEGAMHHAMSAREYLELVSGRRIKSSDVDVLRFELQKELDQ